MIQAAVPAVPPPRTLDGNSPVAAAGTRAIEAAAALGESPWASFARASTVPFLFHGMERAFASPDDPVEAIDDLLDRLTAFLTTAATTGFAALGRTAVERIPATVEDVRHETGRHYGHLFREFSSRSFWDEPVRLLRTRLERNRIDLSRLTEQEVLDAGCGGGRYTVAWRLLGARRAVGLDASDIGILDAHGRARHAAIAGVAFARGDVLALPFAGESFGTVFSNGVLHHTVNWQAGVHELIRVLKPRGLGWLYLVEAPGGLFWDVIEILRAILRGERRDQTRTTLGALGIPANRTFYMLDHVMVPINVRNTPAAVEQALADAGGVRIRRLLRGADFDRIEQIHRRDPYASIKYGVGENRYVFSKD